MVEAVALRRNIEVSLAILADEVEALPERVGEADGSWSDTWPTYMARFEWLIDLAKEGRLTPTERAECERLLHQLQESLRYVVQLGLYVPPKLVEAMERLGHANMTPSIAKRKVAGGRG